MGTLQLVVALGAALYASALPQVRAQTPACAETVERPTYPRLARIAAIQELVKVHFEIGPDGQPANVLHGGNGVLASEAESSIRRTQFGPRCRGNIGLIYNFVLEGKAGDEPHTTVVFKSPNEYVATSNPTGMLCMLYATPGKSWIIRLFTGH